MKPTLFILIPLLAFSLSGIWNEPIVGAVTDSTAQILIGLDGDDSTVVEFGLSVSYGSKSDTVYGQFNKMSLSGLSGDTIYHYKVVVWRGGDSTETSNRVFRTQNTTGTYNFIILGDFTSDWRSAYSDLLLKQIRSEQNIDFVIQMGDETEIDTILLNDDTNFADGDSVWHIWHACIDSMVDSMMMLPILGNHDMITRTFVQGGITQAHIESTFTVYHRAAIEYPALDSGYYWFRWGDCAFVIMHTHWGQRFGQSNATLGATQLEWARNVFYDSLPSEEFNWRFAFYHQTSRDTVITRENWQDGHYDSLANFLDSANVDIAFHGHRHHYNYQGKFDNTKHIISGGGGGTLTAAETGFEIIAYHYLLVNVYPDSIKGYIKNTTGDTLGIFILPDKYYKLGKVKLGKVKL